jgi:DMSO/TMAO reductase YedYZ molybdopterin-dependent catalytic subunit
MKKLFFVFLIGVMLLSAGCQTTVQAPTQVATEAPVPTEAPIPVTVLELVKDDEVIYMTMDQIKALPSVEGLSGMMSSTGKITVPVMHKGVLLSELLKAVGGITEDRSIEVVAEDGYAITYSPKQIENGEYITYDVSSGDEMDKIGTLQTMLAYEREGEPLNPESEGQLRLVVIGESNLQVVDGHWLVKYVNKIVLKDPIEDWIVEFSGAIDEPMDRATFESGAAQGCHLYTWKDPDGNEWAGIPLYYLLGRVDDEVKHGDDSYRDDLAKAGYTVDLIAKDGYTVTLDSFTTMRNDDLIVAYLMNGKPLEEDDFPLKLVGEELTKKQMVGGIAKVVINFTPPESTSEPTPEASTEITPEPVSQTPAVMGPADAVITLTGLVEAEKPIIMDDLVKLFKVMNTSVEHPKKGAIEVTGINLSELLLAVTIKPEAKTVAFIAKDGYQVEMPLADLQNCSDCLLGWTEDMLTTYMPGFESNFWAKDLVTIEFK